jgi:hypothetical protein
MKLPRALATTAARGSGLVRANPAALTDTGPAGQGAIAAGRALSSAADDLFKIQQHKQKISDDTQTDRIGQNINIWSGAQDQTLDRARIETPQDQEKYLAGLTKGYNEMVELELKGMSNGVRRNVKRTSSRHFSSVHENARRKSSAKFIKYTTVTELGISNAEAAAGDIDAADKRIDDLLDKGIIGPQKAAAAKADNVEVLKESSIDNTKPLIEQALIANEFDTDKANEVIDEAVGLMEKEGILNKVEAADARQELSNWAADTAAQRKKQAKDAIKLTTTETYNEFMPLIIDGDLKFDDIDNSKLSKSGKVNDNDKWKSYLRQSHKDPPKSTTPKGLDVSFNAVYGATTLQLSPTEAYDNLLKARFIDGAITDEAFKWGVSKINNPYKKDTLENLKFVLAENKSKVRKGLNTAAEEARLVNSSASLVQWVDDQLEAGKTPTRKEMNAMASQFRVDNGTLVDVGQIVQKGGREWEIVGFDEDGEPLVDDEPWVDPEGSFKGGLGGEFGGDRGPGKRGGAGGSF